MGDSILFLIGNGFDLSLGYKTDYISFCKQYVNLESASDDIALLKEKIGRDFNTWADLEKALGQLKLFKDSEKYIACIQDLKGELREYLKKEAVWSNAKYKVNNMGSTLVNPEKFLTDAKQLEFSQKLQDFSVGRIRIVNFNYTDLLEQAVRLTDRVIDSFLYVHGKLDNEMNLGVNDASQIAVSEFRGSDSVLEEIVKPLFNDACENTNNQSFERMIEYSRVFVIYGLSLGDTDLKWWKSIGKRINQRQDTCVIYYPYDKEKDTVNQPNRNKRWNSEYQDFFCKKAGITDENKGRVFVSLNSNFMKTTLKKV